MKPVKILAIGCAAIGALIVVGIVLLMIRLAPELEDRDVARLVATDCMLPAIGPGDCFPTVQTYEIAGRPRRGDVAYFRHTDGSPTVRQVVGLPGDRVPGSEEADAYVGEDELLVGGVSQAPGCGPQRVSRDQIIGKLIHLARSCEGKVRDGDPIVLSDSFSLGLGVRVAARSFHLGFQGFAIDDLTGGLPPPEAE